MFGTINFKIRPLKLACLIDPHDIQQVRQAIQLNSTLWGGSYNPIIPIYKKTPLTWADKPFKPPHAKTVIRGYVEAFDPDILVQLSSDAPAFIKDLGLKIIAPNQIWEELEKDEDATYPKFGIGIFELLNEIFRKNFKFKRKYPIKISIPKIPKKYSLFWASLFGEIPQTILEHLEKDYFEPLEIERVDVNLSKFSECLARNILFPRRITQYALHHINRSGPRKDANVFFLDATKANDIIDFWNLRALGRRVVPLPKQYQENGEFKKLIVNFLRLNRKPWKHDPKVCDFASIIRGRNCSMEELKEFAKTLNIEKKDNDLSKDPYFSLQHWYPRIWDEWARDKDGAIPDDIFEKETSIEIGDTEKLSVQFKQLLPECAFKHAYSGEPRCANEISFRFYGTKEYLAEVFPKSSGENFLRSISSFGGSRGDWRIGRNGLVKLVEDDFNEHWDIPSSEGIFFSWLRDQGWEPELSTPGLLAKQIFKNLDGHVSIFINEKILGLIEHMNGGTVRKDGSPLEKNKITQERELPVGEVKNKLQEVSKRGNLHDYLLSKGVFRLGVRLQCPNCLRNSWYSLENVRDTLSCPKCLNTFAAVGNVDDAVWCYKTVGPFSIPNYADGAYSVLLALDFFGGHKMHNIRISPVLSFKAKDKGGKQLEADFAAFWQETLFGGVSDGLLFAECKTYSQFEKKDFERMRYLAKTFPGVILVFSTLRKKLAKSEIKQLTRIARIGRKYWRTERPINPVLVLTGNELLSTRGIPYCWEDLGVKEKFKHIYGLINICNATQQIYLNLPSWHDAWREQWEKNRHRKLKKKEELNNSPVTS